MQQTTRMTHQVARELFLASFIVLFQELALIRWLPGQVRVLAYFPNLILLSAFLGLGIGCLRAGKPSLLWLWPSSLLLLIVIAAIGSQIVFTQESSSEHLWLLYYDLPPNALVLNDIKLPIIIGFLASSFTFIPLGQIVASRLQEFNSLSSSLWGYSWDITGSLCGVLCFSLFGYLRIFPLYWFLLFLGIGCLFYYRLKHLNILFAVTIFLICFLVAVTEKAAYYSPYYALSYFKNATSLVVLANGSKHQEALDLSYKSQLDDKRNIHIRDGYHLPYRHLKKTPQKALVLGSGNGNDVAVMLDEGVEQIDAVEIDPVILDVGYRLHPNRPYQSERVRVHNTDARSFLNNTRETYDLIVFGTLDSMTRLSALSNIRLDNYVYTRECLNRAKALLNPDGGMVLYFMVGAQYIHLKLYGILAEAFQQAPVVVNQYYNLFNIIYMSGPAFCHHMPEDRVRALPETLRSIERQTQIPTDDWPYLYLQNKGIGSFYLFLTAIIALISTGAIFMSSRDMRRSLMSGKGFDASMFFFGFAFLLLETRYITQMNLIWGATWITSAVVFGSILLMILISTITVTCRPMPFDWSFGGLLATLILTYFFPMELLLRQHLGLKLLLSVLTVGLPIFFAGTCFALLFEKKQRADIAFGWNLLGAVAGGLAETLTMMIGFKALVLVALCAYLLALLDVLKQRKTICQG